MKKYRMMGPSGPIETMAPSYEKAWNNIRARLHFEYGMSWYDAKNYDHSDLRIVG